MKLIPHSNPRIKVAVSDFETDSGNDKPGARERVNSKSELELNASNSDVDVCFR